jgi:hypothetical protein
MIIIDFLPRILLSLFSICFPLTLFGVRKGVNTWHEKGPAVRVDSGVKYLYLRIQIEKSKLFLQVKIASSVPYFVFDPKNDLFRSMESSGVAGDS